MISERQWSKFLREFAKTGKVGKSCAFAKIDAQTLRYHRKVDPAFEEQYQEALETSLDISEMLLHDDAIDDTTHRKWLLSRLRSDKYGAKKEITHKGIDPGRIAEININIRDDLAEIDRLNGKE